MPSKRRFLKLLPALPVVATVAAALPAPASASTSQVSIFQDDGGLLSANAAGYLQTIKSLGATQVRVTMAWSHIATGSSQPKSPTNPGSYPAKAWAPFDAIDKLAKADGIKLEFDIAQPAPKWAEARGGPSGATNAGVWKPNAAMFKSFVTAVGKRYNGSYSGLPKVSAWSVWNEPNYGISLAPASTAGGRIFTGAGVYRSLVNAEYSALKSTGHGSDLILFGELAPHGYDNPGTSNVGPPLTFLRALYCVGSNYKPVTGSVASGEGCPTTSAASKKFRSQNPLLFAGKGFAAHLYAQGIPPTQTLHQKGVDVANSADLAKVGSLTSTLDKVNKAYGSNAKENVWNTEYGFQTNPPETASANTHPVSAADAAVYINEAEYLSWKNPRIASYDQYLLQDPPAGNFASGLVFASGVHKADFPAYEVPMYMPKTTGTGKLEVWGGARPAHFGGSQNVIIRYTPNGGAPVYTSAPLKNGYFDTKIAVNGPGQVTVFWQGVSPQLSSRTQSVT